MNTIRRTILTASAALLFAALLTGCSPASGDLAGLIPTADQGVGSKTATPTPTAIPGDRDGNGSLSEFEKQILAQNAPRDYTMPGGSVVQIDPTQPLPAAVAAHIAGVATPIVAQLTTADEKASVIRAQLAALIAEQTAATGRGIVIFHHVWSAGANWGPAEYWWVGDFPGKTWPVLASDDRETNLAAVTAAAAARNYELIVID
ncbi:hypothetical protein E3T40_15415 [Cryobacterium sp. TMT1-19]|uniref:hypothetical protein n=1 Tax=unclassified Cryobacterium TaxID=2649013 RepID=UPI000CE3BAFE|nr:MULTISPECIES: hypothetical protein [unclassified Cryobacterium]TFD30379.1 hypothetical protein E3T40_15415 [Cryobacterium sp. TMT1-19]